MDMELIDGAACAATMACGDDLSPDLRNDHILHEEHVAVLRQVLDGVPNIDAALEGECHAVSA